MDQSTYVVLFDGLSIPQDDVCTHDINNTSSLYKQELYTTEPSIKQPAESIDEFSKFLSKEETVLKEGFRSWCENQYLEGSDNFKEESLNESFDLSSYTRLAQRTCGIDLTATTGKYDKILDVVTEFEEKQFETLTQSCSLNDSEEYWCRIDPSAFELKDIDYLRAKCRWHYKNISDFETNPKAIEHMRYLDLFTQCFSLRLLHETACEHNNHGTCYNFQNNEKDNTVNVVCTDNSFSLNNNLECIPEKESDLQSIKESSVNSFGQNYLSMINYEESILSDGFDFTDSLSKEIIDDYSQCFLKNKSNKKRKKKKITFSEDAHISLKEEKSTTCFDDNYKEKDGDAFCSNNNEIRSSNTHLGNEIKKKVSSLNNESIGSLVELKPENENDNDCFTELVDHNNTNKNEDSVFLKNLKDNVDENDMVSSLSAEPSTNSSMVIDKENKYLIKTIHYRPTTKFDSSTQSEAISCESFFTNIVNRNVPEKKVFTKNNIAMNGKLPLKLGSSLLSDVEQTVISETERVTLTSSLLERFVNSKKRRDNYIGPKKETEESYSEEQSTFALDAILHKLPNRAEKVEEQPIIIIGLKYDDHKQSISEESKAQARVRRYIEGDNLCKPGRYVLQNSKHPLKELAKDSGFIYNKESFSDKYHLVHGHFDAPKPLCYSQMTVESDVESEVSANIGEQSFTESDNNSIITISSSDKNQKKSKSKKSKKQACRKCGKNESSLICTDNKHVWNSNKNGKPHVYVSCWKRFCVIL